MNAHSASVAEKEFLIPKREALTKKEPDLVLLDIRMPDRLGTERLPEIKASYPGPAVIISTAVSNTTSLSRIQVTCLWNKHEGRIL